MTKLIQVTLSYCCCCIVVNNEGIIKDTPPILRGWIGALYSKFYLYYEKRGKLKEVKIINEY